MNVRIHTVSHVNGPQVMVKGLRLAEELGYARGASVRVTNPSAPSDPAWTFTVQNDEHATLACRHPRPPSWIRAGVVVRIEVSPPSEATRPIAQPRPRALPRVSDRPSPQARPAEPAPAAPRRTAHTSSSGALFDAYLFVDWGAKDGRYSGADKSDSPWLAEGQWGEGELRWQPERWFSTRSALVEHVRGRLRGHVGAGRRVLVGFDFSYGYPAGFGEALRLGDTSWRGIWDELSAPSPFPGSAAAPINRFATASNENNRFEVAAHLNHRVGSGSGPLYGCPQAKVGPWLEQTAPGFPFVVTPTLSLARLRSTERRLKDAGRNPLPTWWVLGGRAPTVGGQVLTGIPAVRALRDDPELVACSRVWPFETRFTTAPTAPLGPAIVHCEIWPGTQAERFQRMQAADPALVRDQAQVRAMVDWAAEEDAAGTLGRWFGAPAGITDDDRAACEREEGWILGA